MLFNSDTTPRSQAELHAEWKRQELAPLDLRPLLRRFVAQLKSVSSGSRSPRRTERSTLTQRIPRDSASVTACGRNR